MSSVRGWIAEAADLLFPRTCPGCGANSPWCAGCAGTVKAPPREPVQGEAFLQHWPGPLPVVRSLARYSGPVRAAIVAGKERGRRDLPVLLGRELATGLATLIRLGLVEGHGSLVPAPTARAQARARGGDPVAAMAHTMMGAPALGGRWQVADCVYKRWGTRDSVGLTAAQRMRNLAGRIGLRARRLPECGTSVVMIDDVFTTGATAVATARALDREGIRVAAVLTVAAVPAWRLP